MQQTITWLFKLFAVEFQTHSEHSVYSNELGFSFVRMKGEVDFLLRCFKTHIFIRFYGNNRAISWKHVFWPVVVK